MKQLKSKFQRGTKTYTKIVSSCCVFIYEVVDYETNHIYYEVFERKEVKENTLPSGIVFPKRIAYQAIVTSVYGHSVLVEGLTLKPH